MSDGPIMQWDEAKGRAMWPDGGVAPKWGRPTAKALHQERRRSAALLERLQGAHDEIERMAGALAAASSHDQTGEDHLAEMMAMAAEVDPIRAELAAIHKRAKALRDAVHEWQDRVSMYAKYTTKHDEYAVSRATDDVLSEARKFVQAGGDA